MTRRSFFRGLATMAGFCAIGQIPRIGGALPATGRIIVAGDCGCGSLTRCSVKTLSPEELQRLFLDSFFFGGRIHPLMTTVDIRTLEYKNSSLYDFFHAESNR